MTPTPFRRPPRWWPRGLLLAAITAGALALSAAPALAAPAWSVAVEQHNAFGLCHATFPACAEPGGFDPFTESLGESGETFFQESGWNTYTIKITNVGDANSTGGITVSDTLPAGVSLAGGELVPVGSGEESEGPEAAGAGWTCRILRGAHSAVCSTSAVVEKGKESQVELHTHVFSDAVSGSKNTVTVSGGGAAPVAQETATRIGAALPFGIHCFAASVVERESAEANQPCEEGATSGQEAIQAGGHPFSESSETVFNLAPSDRLSSISQLASAGGSVKAFEVEVPPGFLADTVDLPRCPVQILSAATGSGCPASTAIGDISIALPSPSSIKEGTTHPLRVPSTRIFNMQPPPGHVAAFGFVFTQQVIPVLIDAQLRSDGDYGVNVASSGIGEKPLGFRATFCEYGVHALVKGFACRKASEAPLGSKPFLINPTACSAAPAWNAHASPWAEPANQVSQTTMTGAVSGCELLQFHPQLEFGPSSPSEGGSTQADEPSGMTFNLVVPQSSQAGTPASPPLATPALKDLRMTLPAGMTVSPSAADGLQACSNAQFWPSKQREEAEAEGRSPNESAEDEAIGRHREPAVEAKCPFASQVGTVEAFSPLLSGTPVIEPIGPRDVCSQGAWANGPTGYEYQWLRNGLEIPGATSKDYVPVAEDATAALQCQVIATNGVGSARAVSPEAVRTAEPSPPRPFPPSSLASPSGSASVPNSLTCESGAWTGKTNSFTYQLLRGGEPITSPGGSSGETTASSFAYTLTPDDEGKVLQCQVTATNESGAVVAVSPGRVIAPEPSSAPPLPGTPLQGQLFVAKPECSPCGNEDAEDGRLFRLFLQIRDPRDGVIVKLHGTTSANTASGQLTTTFEQQPQQPVELIKLKLKGGPRAVLANPQHCGPAETKAALTPWSEQTTAASATSSFNVDFNGAGGACPGVLPFQPFFEAGTVGAGATSAGAFTQFSLTFGRGDGTPYASSPRTGDREQDLSGLEVHLPLGLAGKIAALSECGEAEIRAAEHNEGECPADSKVGTATAGAGPGPDPFFEQGNVYLTGPYKGGPFGLVVVTPAVAGPFNLGKIVVRASIRIDPNTAAVTTVSDPLPQFRDGVQLRVRKVNVEVNRPGFMLNPTHCTAQSVSATLSSAEGATAQASSKFGIGGCQSLPFTPELTAEVGGHGTKANGTSFIVRVKSAPGQANIAKTFLQLPIALPSRLDTIQKACRDTVFEANPASCPEGSNVGMAVAHSPLLKSPLVGPAYLVSHTNVSFPDVDFVLQGEGVTIVLDGKTDIKKGITYSRFESLPDAPVSTFEAVLPAGPHSALTIYVPGAEQFNACNTPLLMPTEITGQNGAVVKQTTHIALSGCAASTPTVKIASVKVMRNALMVTLKAASAGRLSVSGEGLITRRQNVTAGTHRLRVAFTKLGARRARLHKRTRVRVKLVAGKQTVTTTMTVRL